jgi:hypothetical protein
MTEKRRRRPGPLPVVFSSVATFLAVLSLMAAQLHAGHDPALGSGAQVSTQGGHRVVTRTSGASPAPAAKHGNTHPVTTRTSGGGEGDDE